MRIKKEELENYDLGMSLNKLLSIEVGQSEYVKGTDNKIKRLSEDEFVFLRFDSIHTHIIKEEAKACDTSKIWEDFKEARDYNVKYAQDRCDMIKKTFDEDAGAKAVSSFKFMNQQHKTTNSVLTGETGFSRTLQAVADFIVFSKFDNREEEEKHEQMKAEKNRLLKINKRKRKEAEENKIAEIKQNLKDVPSSYTRVLKNNPEGTTSVEVMLEHNGLLGKEKKVNYIKVDRAIVDGKYVEGEENYWNRISPKEKHDIPFYRKEPINYKEFGISTIRQYRQEIEELENLPLTVDRKKVIANLKSEMRVAMEVLRKIVHFDPTSDIAETISYDSWNHLSMRDTETYVALIYGYSDLHKKYNSKVNTTMWCLLKDFEQLLQDTEWTKEEEVILNFVLETGITEQKEIQEELREILKRDVPQRTLSDWLNITIPNKLLATFEQQLEDWIWIYRRKGKYKTCSKCGEVKLAVDSRYFSKHPKGQFGLQPSCKICDKKRKS